jgi:hypothetical protein
VIPPRTATRRRGHIYGYLTLNPDDRTVIEFGYAGQSRQRRGRRDAQHRDCQPWEDLILGRPHVIADGWWTDDELDAIEQAVIGGNWARARELATVEARRRGAVPDLSGMRACSRAGLRPRYNWDHNEDNPDQIPKWTAVEQRWARDDENGLPRWVPPDERRTVVLSAPRVRWWACSEWTGWHAVGAAWPLLSLLAWAYLHGVWDVLVTVFGFPQAVGWSPLPAALVSAFALGWGVDAGGKWWRRRNRSPWWWPW